MSDTCSLEKEHDQDRHFLKHTRIRSGTIAFLQPRLLGKGKIKTSWSKESKIHPFLAQN